jgi:ABC-type multidrug transport system fused ATPase/permease subunit
MNPWFLQYWTLEHDEKRDVWKFTSILLGISLVNSLAMAIRNYAILMSNVRISKEISFIMAFRLIHASVNNFFDRVPMGRILNRFIRDTNEIDWNLGYSSQYLVQIVFVCIADLAAAVYASSPVMILFIIFYFYCALRVQRHYMNLYREVIRLKSICTTPMIQAFSEGITGVATIRTYKKAEFSLNNYIRALDDFQKNCITGDALIRWFTLRLYFFSTMLIIPSLALNLLLVQTGPGIFALLMKYLLVVMTDINDLLDTVSTIENRMIAFERCTFYTNIVPEKGYRDLEKLEANLRKGKIPQLQSDSWPKTGRVEMRDLRVRYRAGLSSVIKSISLTVEHGSKVGIVGRTGAGKTTLVSALYRNFDEYEGEILIDGKELREVDLKVLRSNITVIPQDPYLFNDTVRNNLDPLGKKTDEQIIDILKDIDLWQRFQSEKGLNTKISQSGGNLSQGERQLLCLSRALLFKNKLILMDEATANIDPKSEATIQRLLTERFEESTIFMIAHRLNTILQCDKLLVLEKGEVLEFGDTESLREDKTSFFYEMLNTFETMQQNLA